MKLRTIGLISTLVLGLLAGPLPTEAQQAGKVYRIGYLRNFRSGSPTVRPSQIAFRQRLRELGYVEGKNIVIEPRFAQRKLDRFPGLAAELVGLKVDAIVVNSVQGALAARKATRRIPVVFAIAQNPVGVGLVTSLAQPGGNVTGLTDFARELAGKRLELLKEIVPKLSRMAVLVWNPAGPDYAAEKNELDLAARALGLQLEAVEARGPDDLESAFSATNQ